MPVYRIVLSYDGSEFHGWQRQPEQRTVQGELERALSIIYQDQTSVQGAGRTDAGVHALGQCASFAPTKELPTKKIFASLRSLLPEDMCPLELHRAPDDFNARFKASARFYTYRLGLGPCPPLRRIRWEPPFTLDLAAMRSALPALRAATDFTSFCTREAAAKGSRCEIRELLLELEGDEMRLRIGADRFLHNMVRIVVGTLVEIGRGRWHPERMSMIIAARDRCSAGPTAPPQGLFLARVEYPEAALTMSDREPD